MKVFLKLYFVDMMDNIIIVGKPSPMSRLHIVLCGPTQEPTWLNFYHWGWDKMEKTL